MDTHTWIDRLQQDLDGLQRAGIPDRDVAYALMATRTNHALDEALLPHAEPIWRLAWLISVRAPALDLHWLVKGVLATDKVYWEVLPLRDLVGRLAELERAAADQHTDVDAWLCEPIDIPELTIIRTIAAKPTEVAGGAGPALRDRIRTDIAKVQACAERGNLLDLAIEPGPRG